MVELRWRRRYYVGNNRSSRKHAMPAGKRKASPKAPPAKSKAAPKAPQTSDGKLPQYECGAFQFRGNDIYDRHLVFDHKVQLENATPRERYEALARSLRDLLMQRWLLTNETQEKANAKTVHYLSMEFLIGRSLANNLMNLGVEKLVVEDLESDQARDWHRVAEIEPDAGLGNGGLGRLAACFIESLATLQIPAVGHGLRYQYGIFRQDIVNGYQVEHPDNWLRFPDPWEVARPEEAVEIKLGCSIEMKNGALKAVPGVPMTALGIPFDRPVVGYGGRTINTLRLWEADCPQCFDFGEFSSGDFVGAVQHRIFANTVTRVLYPDDSTEAGRALRFLQEFFLVSCAVADMVRTFRRRNQDWNMLPEKAAAQLNDTHPSLAVPELLRILLDQANLPWSQAWDLTCRTLAYTNHTLLPEALEKWPVRAFEILAPRHLELIYEINRRFLDDVRTRFPGDDDRVRRMSLIEEGPSRKVRMAHLAIVGSHSTNGVAAIHSNLLRTRTVADFAQMFPERFNNKTNGVTPRRWLLNCNPFLARLITEAIGDAWITDLFQLRKLLPLAQDSDFRQRFRQAKRQAKERFAGWLKNSSGAVLDPDTIFDCQVKRIHEYKRQLLNVLQIVVLYNRLRANPKLNVPARTFLFGGKAAPAYRLAKLIIKLINSVARTIDADPAVCGKLKVLFLPDYCVTLAERLIPASDVSEQISTAGYEASGTSNMKFMMNGALTVGTRDGATIEMAEEAGEDNFFLFGLTAEEVAKSRGWYNPWWHYENEPEVKQALDLIFSNHFNADEPGIFEPIRELLLQKGDYYMHLADLMALVRTQERVGQTYQDPEKWARMAIANVACSGKFSSDRTIQEYAADIWQAEPCPVP
jgi:starch phosphorylase